MLRSQPAVTRTVEQITRDREIEEKFRNDLSEHVYANALVNKLLTDLSMLISLKNVTSPIKRIYKNSGQDSLSKLNSLFKKSRHATEEFKNLPPTLKQIVTVQTLFTNEDFESAKVQCEKLSKIISGVVRDLDEIVNEYNKAQTSSSTVHVPARAPAPAASATTTTLPVGTTNSLLYQFSSADCSVTLEEDYESSSDYDYGSDIENNEPEDDLDNDNSSETSSGFGKRFRNYN